jgi:hypothetical protein
VMRFLRPARGAHDRVQGDYFTIITRRERVGVELR